MESRPPISLSVCYALEHAPPWRNDASVLLVRHDFPQDIACFLERSHPPWQHILGGAEYELKVLLAGLSIGRLDVSVAA